MKDVVARKHGTSSPCAACKLLRRRCAEDCVFAPYFPADEPQKFANVHKVFGASNVNKMLQELPPQHRSDAVSSMVYEANARVQDPVYGCVGAISSLQHQINVLQTQLAIAQAEVVHLQMRQAAWMARLSRSNCGDGEPIRTAAAMPPTRRLIEPYAKPQFTTEVVATDGGGGGDMSEHLWSC